MINSLRLGLLFTLLLFVSSLWASTESEIEARLTTSFNILLRELPTLNTKNEAEDLIRRHVLPITDTNATARLMLGKYWRQANELQRHQFVDAMTDKLIKTYATFLLDDRARKTQFVIDRISKKDSSRNTLYTVYTTVTVDQPTAVNFTIYDHNGEWKMIDVSVEGISLVLNFRTALSSLIERDGLDKVIDDIKNDNVKVR